MTHEPRALVEPLAEASGRLVRTVDGFHGDDWTSPSGLPDWTRAHVVAHLTLNAEGLAGVLRGVVGLEPVPMYASQEARNADIEELAGADHGELRERLLAGCTAYADAFAAVPDDRLETQVERVPGGATFSAGESILMRYREVEIHHADLDAGYSRTDWQPGFLSVLLTSASRRPFAQPFQVAPTDSAERLSCGGPGGPTVSGSAADLGWWLTGRDSGGGVTSSDGTVPEVASW